MNTYSRSQLIAFLSFFILIGGMCTEDLGAQTKIKLDEAIQLATQSNRSVHLANQEIAVEQATYEQTKGHFLPYFGVSLTDMITNDPLNVFGFKLKQEIVEQADFNPAILNDPDVINQFNLTFNAMMPLYNPEAKAEQAAVGNQIEMKRAMAQRTIQGIRLEVIKSYYMLQLAQDAVQVLEDTHQASKANYSIAENYFNQGLMLKSDLLDMNIMVNQSKLALGSAKINVANAQSQFNYVLNTEEITEFIPTDKLIEIDELDLIEGELNLNRADFMAMNHGIDAMNNMNVAADKSFLPKVKAFGTYELNDAVPLENNATNFMLGIGLTWDIYKGNKRKSSINKTSAQIRSKQIELDQNIAQAELEILNTRRAIKDSKLQISLHDLSINQAKESLKIRKNRFEQGLEKSTDIINAETQLAHKKLARLNSLFELNIKQAYLKFLLN